MNRGTKQNKHGMASNQIQSIIAAPVICRFLPNTYIMSMFFFLDASIFGKTGTQITIKCGGTSKNKGGGGG